MIADKTIYLCKFSKFAIYTVQKIGRLGIDESKDFRYTNHRNQKSAAGAVQYAV